MIHGESVLRRKHATFKKRICEICGEKNKEILDLHHEPRLNKTGSPTWSGKLITLCRKCHTNVGRLELSNSVGISWTAEQTYILLH